MLSQKDNAKGEVKSRSEIQKSNISVSSCLTEGMAKVKSRDDVTYYSSKTLAERKENVVLVSPKLIETAMKYGLELAKSFDPLVAAFDVTGSTILGTCLSKFSASQCAGLVGVIVASVAPQTAVPILIKKISQDLDDLKGSLNIVRENPQYMANEFLSMAMQCLTEYNIQKALANLRRAEYESTRGTHMSPSFDGVLACVQIRTFSKVMIECASEIDGMLCFMPIHCLPSPTKKKVEMIIKEGLSIITKKAETKKWNGKFAISAAMQDKIDPLLGALYNTFSLAAGYTDPYKEYELSTSCKTKFTVDVTYAPEGENDTCKLELLLRSDGDIVFFIWKNIGKYRSHLCLRYEKFTWNLDITNGVIFHLEYDHLLNSLSANGKDLEKTVGWPHQRKTSSELIKEAKAKMNKKLKCLSYPTYKWIENLPMQYLKSMNLGLEDKDEEGISLLHILTEMNNRKALKCIIGKLKDIDVANQFGETPLHVACAKGFYRIAKMMIENGADVNAVTKDGNTPLILAVGKGSQILKLLLSYDVDTEHSNNENMRAIDIAKQKKADKQIIALLHPHQLTA